MTIPNYYFEADALPNYKKFLSEDPLADSDTSDSDYDPNSESTSSEDPLADSEEEEINK